MKTIKVSEATGIVLDYLVAKAQGREEIKIFAPHRPADRGWIEVRFNPEPKASTARFDPTVSWEFGGPIIEAEGISLLYLYVTEDPFRWAATEKPTIRNVKPKSVYGPTALIAAMRCFVASKLGETVEVLDELT